MQLLKCRGIIIIVCKPKQKSNRLPYIQLRTPESGRLVGYRFCTLNKRCQTHKTIESIVLYRIRIELFNPIVSSARR